jgi:hypothetical protein
MPYSPAIWEFQFLRQGSLPGAAADVDELVRIAGELFARMGVNKQWLAAVPRDLLECVRTRGRAPPDASSHRSPLLFSFFVCAGLPRRPQPTSSRLCVPLWAASSRRISLRRSLRVRPR